VEKISRFKKLRKHKFLYYVCISEAPFFWHFEVALDHKFEKAAQTAETLRSSNSAKCSKMFANLENFRLYVHRQYDEAL
jgi:hypothetical protein